MTINRKIFLALWVIFFVDAKIAMAEDMATISVVMTGEHLQARNPNTTEVLCSFDVEVVPNSQRKDGDNFIFFIRLVHVEFKTGISPEEISFLHNNLLLKTHLEDKYYVSDNFEVMVPANQVSNCKFHFQTELVVKRSDINLSTDALQFYVEANLDISLSQTRINLGKLVYENGRIISLGEPQVTLRYSALCPLKCRITSENGFCLKHTTKKILSSLIPYKLRLRMDGIPNDCYVQEPKAVLLPIASSAWTGQAEVSATVNDDMLMPIQGTYGDRVTFSITPND